MSPDRLRALGRALYATAREGSQREGHWVTPLADALGCSRSTVHRWLAAEVTPPDDLEARLERLAHQRVADILAALREG